METEDKSKMLEENPNKEENKKIFRRCSWCEIEFTWSEFWEHHDNCKRKNSISQIDIRRNQKYIKNGKMYTISDIEHVFRRNKHRSSQVNSIIVRLYCDEDQTSIRHAFSCDRRFKLDENNHIIIE
jgi:hypothetical protein